LPIGKRAEGNELTERAKTILVRACKSDGSEYRRWKAEVIRQEGPLIVLDAKFDRQIKHEHLGTILKGTASIEYYWLDRWYNVFRFSQPDGSLRNFYCNINEPPSFDGSVLSYIDLDIDVVVNPDLSYVVLDLDDFERNGNAYGYSAETRFKARAALDELTGMINAGDFPFNLN
jgi:protein associated with RNAse G/E